MIHIFKFVYLTTLVTSKVLSIGRSQFNVHTDERTQMSAALGLSWWSLIQVLTEIDVAQLQFNEPLS
jgi:hypothetical protein